MASLSDRWAAGATYDGLMGRWSRVLAPRFVSWLAVRPAAHWLDVGCGTGALGEAICAAAGPFLGGTGPAPAYVATLEPRRREALAEHLERSLPREPDGAIPLVARAWAVRGVAR